MPRCISYSVVGSTQEVALRLGREGAPHGTLVTAETQLLGRGREGRTWVSPKGGFYASMVLRLQPAGFPLLSLAVGLELRASLAPTAPRADVLVKWPNDLMIAGKGDQGTPRKVGGVLTDIVTRPGIDSFAVVGVGINLDGKRSEYPVELVPSVGFLREFSDLPLVPKQFEPLVRDALLRACERLARSEGRQSLPDELRPYLWGVGRSFRVGGARATFQGIGQEGEALVQREGGGPVQAVRAGELSLEVS